MTDAAKFLKESILKRLHDAEDALEQANALNPDPRLSDAEIALHVCIADVQRASEACRAMPVPGRRRSCCGDLSGPSCFNCPAR